MNTVQHIVVGKDPHIFSAPFILLTLFPIRAPLVNCVWDKNTIYHCEQIALLLSIETLVSLQGLDNRLDPQHQIPDLMKRGVQALYSLKTFDCEFTETLPLKNTLVSHVIYTFRHTRQRKALQELVKRAKHALRKFTV